MSKSRKEPVFLFLTTLSDAHKACALYAKRWKIECLFRHLKTNGYNLEALNMRDAGKNLLMLAIVITAYILAIREGQKRQKQIRVNCYKDGTKWPNTSIFREGLSILTQKYYQFSCFLKYVFNALTFKNQIWTEVQIPKCGKTGLRKIYAEHAEVCRFCLYFG